jgi:signal transduction histidine kinase
VRVPLDAIARYRPDLRNGHRVVTEGTVIYSISGRFFFIQDGAIGVRVQTRDPDSLAVGERVEVAGFLDMTQPVAGLTGAVYRRTGHAPAPKPIPIEPESIIALNNEASFYGKRAEPGDFHGCLATFPARLIEVREVTDGGLMTLAVGKTTVAAWCSPEDFVPLRRLQPGSEVQVTGVVVHERVKPADGIESLTWPLVDRLRVLLRSPADIVVVTAPSWWTPRRLALALAAVAGVAGMAILWAFTLRRQVKRQMAVIEGQVQREAAMEERRRIASEFHDTLEQDLAGVALRLDVASGRTEDLSARAVLEQQRGLLDRIRTETREFLWDLRDPSRRDGSLADSLQAQVDYMQSFTTVPLELRCEGGNPQVTPLVQHHLLRFVREAVATALKHAAPSKIEVRLGADRDWTSVEVVDDGSGFDVEARASVVGHFGIRGMRERARRIGGTMEIESGPGRGATVAIRVPREAEEE